LLLRSTPSPYPTLFRSAVAVEDNPRPHLRLVAIDAGQALVEKVNGRQFAAADEPRRLGHCPWFGHAWYITHISRLRLSVGSAKRSEEHTSELQSPDHLV